MSATLDPRVVALVPAWNAARFIRPTLEALLAQSYRNLRVLVSVDLSSDETADICDAFASTEPRVRVMRQTKRMGFVGNTRCLLDAAEGDYFFWAWHDDLILPEYVSRLVPALETNHRVVCAYSDLEFHQFDGTVDTGIYTRLDGITDPVERAKRVLWRPKYWWLPHRGLFRADAGASIGGFRRHLAGDYCADWPWAVHMATLGEHVRVPGVLCRKFIKEGSLSRSFKRNPWTDIAVMLSCGREIHRSPLTVKQKTRLQLTVAGAIEETLRAASKQMTVARLRERWSR